MSEAQTTAPTQAPSPTPKQQPIPEKKQAPQVAAPKSNGKAETLGQDVKPPEAVKPPPPKRYKVKIDGQESEVEEDELVRSYQIRKAGDKRLEEAAMERKKAEEFLNKLKTPEQLMNVLIELGYNPTELAETHLSKHLQYELMSPEQKRAYQAELKLKQYEEEMARRKADEERTKNMTETEQSAMTLQKSIIDVLETRKLPKKPSTVWRIARQMLINMDHGIDADPNDVVNAVAREIQQEHKDLYSDLDGEQLLSLFGEEIANKLRKHDLSRLKTPVMQSRAPGVPKLEKSEKRKYITDKELEAYLKEVKRRNK